MIRSARPSLRSSLTACAALCMAACGGNSISVNVPVLPPAATGTLTITSCTVAAGSPTCAGTIAWTSQSATTPTVSVDGTVVAEGNAGALPYDLPGTFVEIVLSDGGTVLDTITIRGVCVTASAWDGANCEVYGQRLDERAPTPFIENGAPVELEVVIFKPDGPGRFPAVMFNHGSTGNGSDPSLFTQTFVSETVAEFFVSRGYLVAFPQRRGRGQSDGLYDEGFNADRSFYSCDRDITLAGANRAQADLDVMTDWLRSRADVDSTRVLAAGTSRGGVSSLVLSARRPDAITGAINFVGGWLGEGCGDDVVANRALFTEAAGFGAPTLWLYANNDSFYSVAYSQANFDAFTQAGGLGTFELYTRQADLNGHFLINDPPLWGADVDAYLASLP